jgi:predicted RecA/RadA family phage recombinase
MRNYIQPGDVVDLPAPTGGAVSGVAYLIGALLCIAMKDGAQTVVTPFLTRGVVDLPKAASVTPAVGAKAFWNSSAKTVTGTSAAGLYEIGTFTEAPASGDATVNVRLNGVGLTVVP